MMRYPPRHERGMDAITFVPVALVVQPQACVTHKRPLTNRIRRHFARIKAVGLDCGRSWLLRQNEACETSNKRSRDVKDGVQGIPRMKVQDIRGRKSGHFVDESQETSGP